MSFFEREILAERNLSRYLFEILCQKCRERCLETPREKIYSFTSRSRVHVQIQSRVYNEIFAKLKYSNVISFMNTQKYEYFQRNEF